MDTKGVHTREETAIPGTTFRKVPLPQLLALCQPEVQLGSRYTLQEWAVTGSAPKVQPQAQVCSPRKVLPLRLLAQSAGQKWLRHTGTTDSREASPLQLLLQCSVG